MFSINDGLNKVEDLVDRAKELGFSHLAITDHGRMGGIIRFAKRCSEVGIEGIVGNEIYFYQGDMKVKQNVLRDGKMKRPKHNHITMLCKNETGYKNLVEMANIGATEGYYYEPRVDWSVVEKRLDGLVVTSGCPSGIAPQEVLKGNFEAAEKIICEWREIIGEDYYLEIQNHGLEIEKPIIKFMIEMSRKHGIKLVAANDVHYIFQNHANAHTLLKHLRMKNTENSGIGYGSDQFYLRSAEEMYELFSEVPDACKNTMEIAEKCEYRFPIKTTWKFPAFSIEKTDEFESWKASKMPHFTDHQAFLKYLAIKGLKTFSLFEKQEYKDRTRFELDKIFEMGTEEYFLILWDIFRFCKEKGIGVGPGRGCLTGDALVLTKDDGFKRLDEIKIGDSVFTHSGKSQKVKNTFKYNILNEKLLNIKTENSFDSITLTKDHKILGSKVYETHRYKLPQKNNWSLPFKCKKYDFNPNPEWFTAEELTVGDMLFVKYPNRKIIDFEKIDLSEFVDSNYKTTDDEIILINPLTKNETTRFSRYIEQDEDWFYFCGRWIGDGWYEHSEEEKKYRLGISFHSEDFNGINRICLYLEKLGLNPKITKHKDKNLIQVHIYNKIITKLFSCLFKDYKFSSSTKYIGKFKYVKDSLLRQLLLGLKHSNGSNELSKKIKRENIDTTSYRLLLDLRECLLYLKIPNYISRSAPYKIGNYNCKESYRIRFKGLELEKDKKHSNLEDGYFIKIKNISETTNDFVYDLSIDDDSSYLTQNFVVHNSGAGSLVLYLLEISFVDPLDPELNLMFERFLNPGRSSQYKFEFKEYPVSQWKEDGGETESTGKLRELVGKMMESDQFRQYTPSLIREILPLENQNLDNYYYDLISKDIQIDGNPVNSWIAYCLDLVQEAPDGPLEVYKMGSLPDVDSDFDHKRRHEVIEYVIEKYGQDHVVNIGTYQGFSTRSCLVGALKDAGINHEDALSVSKAIPKGAESIVDALKAKEVSQALRRLGVKRSVVDNAAIIEGSAFSAVSEHAAGVVISPHNLMDKIPLHKAKDAIVSQFDLSDMESAGYIKFDFLGLSNVGKLSRCLEYIKNRPDDGIEIDFRSVDRNDKGALSIFSQGWTSTVFQFWRPHVKEMLKPQQVGVDSFNDIVAINALNRPGPMKYISKDMYDKQRDPEKDPKWTPGITYAENKKNPDKIKYIHKDLEPILESTYGILVYQEQIMQIAQVVGGFTLSEADVLRKAVGKKDGDLFEWCRKKFFDGAERNNYSKDVVQRIWNLAQDFASYSFNKAHSTVYGLSAYWNAYLLNYFPHEWYAASINEDIEKEDKVLMYIDEINKINKQTNANILFVYPNVNTSTLDCFVDYNYENSGEFAIVLPLNFIKGIGKNAISVIESRETQQYKNFKDFCYRARPNKMVLEKLIDGGACDCFISDVALNIGRNQMKEMIVDIKNEITKIKKTEEFEKDVPEDLSDLFNLSSDWSEIIDGDSDKLPF